LGAGEKRPGFPWRKAKGGRIRQEIGYSTGYWLKLPNFSWGRWVPRKGTFLGRTPLAEGKGLKLGNSGVREKGGFLGRKRRENRVRGLFSSKGGGARGKGSQSFLGNWRERKRGEVSLNRV